MCEDTSAKDIYTRVVIGGLVPGAASGAAEELSRSLLKGSSIVNHRPIL